MADFENALSGLGEGISQVGTAGMEARLSEVRAQIELDKLKALEQYKSGIMEGERQRIGGLLSRARRPDGSIDRQRAQDILMESGDFDAMKSIGAADVQSANAEYIRGAKTFGTEATAAARMMGKGGFGRGQIDMEKLTDAIKDYTPKDLMTNDSAGVMAAVENQARFNAMSGMGAKESANKAWMEYSSVLAQTGDEKAAINAMKKNMKDRIEKMRQQPAQQPAQQPPANREMAQQETEAPAQPPPPAQRRTVAEEAGRPRGLLQFGRGALVRPDGTLYVGEDKTGPRWKK